MRKLIIRDKWTLRLAGLCAGLALLLLINSLWQPEARLAGIASGEVPAESGEPPAGEARTDAPNAKAAAVPGSGDATRTHAPNANAAAPGMPTPPRRRVKPLPAYGVTLKRPLFQANRRPAPVQMAKPKIPPKPKAPPRSNLNGIRLTGVIMTAQKAIGLLSIPGQSELMRVREGQVIKGWKVISVMEDALVFNNGEEDFRMALWEEKPKPPPPERLPQRGPQPRGQGQKTAGSGH